MIELMEMAAARLMKPRLQRRRVVGRRRDEHHVRRATTAPADAGYTCARWLRTKGIAGKLHRFTINAFDESGLIGTAEHTRAVLVERRFIESCAEQARTASADQAAIGLNAMHVDAERGERKRRRQRAPT